MTYILSYIDSNTLHYIVLLSYLLKQNVYLRCLALFYDYRKLNL